MSSLRLLIDFTRLGSLMGLTPFSPLPFKAKGGIIEEGLILPLNTGSMEGESLLRELRLKHAASRDLDFQGFAIGIIRQEMPEKLAQEVDFTLNGVNDVERFLEWMSQTTARQF